LLTKLGFKALTPALSQRERGKMFIPVFSQRERGKKKPHSGHAGKAQAKTPSPSGRGSG
jgi:hypothetical protein